MSKPQGNIASSSYIAEFSVLRTATEEAQSLRYTMRCIGCTVPSDGTCSTRIFGNNLINTLFLEDSLDHAIPPTILEEDNTSQT